MPGGIRRLRCGLVQLVCCCAFFFNCFCALVSDGQCFAARDLWSVFWRIQLLWVSGKRGLLKLTDYFLIYLFSAPDGNCCSSYGFCGSGSDFCGAGCQPGYGDCDVVSSSSSVAPASSTTVPPAYGSTGSSAPAVSPPPAYTSLNDRPSSSSASASYATAATSSSTSAASSTSAYLVLPSPTQCSFGDPPDTDEDDSYCQVNLAQPLTLYGQTYTTSYPSTNGLIGFGAGSTSYMTDTMPDATLGIAALAPMWTDQFAAGAYQQPTQGIFYQNTTSGITWEFYLQNMNDASRIWHYTVAYSFANAGVFTYTYYSVGSGYNGDPGVVGMQGCKCFFLFPSLSA